jgi:hypothetical protein
VAHAAAHAPPAAVVKSVHGCGPCCWTCVGGHRCAQP